jgi:ribosome-binding factor A
VGDAIAHRLHDPRISRFCSVTRVEVSRDLQLARVYVSVMGTEADERKTLAGLQHAVGHLRRVVGRELSLRTTPELRFEIDHSIKRTADTLDILRRVLPEESDDDAQDLESGGEDHSILRKENESVDVNDDVGPPGGVVHP